MSCHDQFSLSVLQIQMQLSVRVNLESLVIDIDKKEQGV
ncbi:predicted protein [Sclerotinia sclerotiorum 1980 UF-70]|uniref:Uncharacterized protein n=1 Tax=Sclerotinia sclerotiorum (strain ATCC 18683 / 1980 / Ss-1) TaxID=665079 RepID=A7ESZ8_SCLS1|nr:predicted protein [Sclerotinia sclerotiorum 1980 UF-70]EDN92590.1 predicted protein [Sclerotinia sclerotiorum 1980 UF-70]